jgi:hypothetical protein
MSVWQIILRSNFIIKLRSWEYWPFGIIQFPVIMYWLWLSMRARTFLFFSASNPGIIMGGMFGESKYDVLKKVPSDLIPKTILIQIPISTQSVIEILKREGYSFPVVFKPDLGERGHMVRRINTPDDIAEYITTVKSAFLVQELIDLPKEFGVFYTRFPNEEKGVVTSVVMKEMLGVTGDGKTSLQDLILKQDRAKLQWHKLRLKFKDRLSEIIPNGKSIELVSIGNHALGTKFLDGSHLINAHLSTTFDRISKQIDGFYFGRYDLRCNTLDDLYSGNIKVLELNGCGAEPAHIYQPGYSFFKAVKVLIIHWRNIFLIARQNHLRGVAYISRKEARRLYRRFKAATQ